MKKLQLKYFVANVSFQFVVVQKFQREIKEILSQVT